MDGLQLGHVRVIYEAPNRAYLWAIFSVVVAYVDCCWNKVHFLPRKWAEPSTT